MLNQSKDNRLWNIDVPVKIACSALITLPFPIRLPCIKVHKASWDKKPVQERRGEILLSLGALAQDVRAARTLSQPGCGSSLLERLERSVNNYLHIVTHLDIEQGEPECPALACLGQDTQDLGQVLRHFGLLLTGKLEWLIIELTQRCQTESLPFTS